MKTQIVLLAAGKSSRFYPFNDIYKSMFSVCGKPILGWTLDGLKKIGAAEVIVVVSKDDKDIQGYLKNYKRINLTVVYQEKPLGMGDALLSAKDRLGEEFIVGFPHLVDPKSLETLMKKRSSKTAASILADETEEPWKYGMLLLEGKNKVIGIVEKPLKGREPSKIRAAGVYFLNKNFLRALENTSTEEYSFETALDRFMKEEEVEAVMSEDSVFSLKYPWDIFKIRDYILENIPETRAKNSQISSSAILKGKIILEKGSKIFDHALVEGPVYIGREAVVGAYSILRDHSALEAGAEIQRYADCTRSIFSAGSHLHSGFVGDSIIGKSVRIGAGFITANRRIDRANINVIINDKKVATGRNYLGVLVGESVRVGINVSTMPGVILGPKADVGPGTIVMKNVESNTLIYTKQNIEVREKT